MEVKWEGRETDGRYVIRAIPGEYDGVPPVSELKIDNQPLFFNNDILAVVGVLLFGEYTSGVYVPPGKVSPEVAEAIQRYLEPQWVGIENVNLNPVANPLGDGTLIVSPSLGMWEKYVSVWGKPKISTVCALPSVEISGAITSVNGIALASNGDLLGKFSKRGDSLLSTIAVGLLYCETYRAQSLMIDPTFVVEESEFRRLYNLISSCKISLQQFDETHLPL